MTGSMLIDGMMVFFTFVLLAAAAVPVYLVMPKWMADEKERRIAFHRGAVDAIGAELARPQNMPEQLDRLRVSRQQNVEALLSLDPSAVVPPLGAEIRTAA